MTTEKKKFNDRSEIADFFKETLKENSSLLNDSTKAELEDAIDCLYDYEASPDYEDSYEDSSC